MGGDMRIKKRWLALICFAAWTVLLVAMCGPTMAQATYSFAVGWTQVDMDTPHFYQIGVGLADGEYTTVKAIESQWDTATVVAPHAGPWFVAIRTCLPRGDGEPLCGDTWTLMRQAPGSDNFGPHYPAQVVIVNVEDAWLRVP